MSIADYRKLVADQPNILDLLYMPGAEDVELALAMPKELAKSIDLD